MLHSLRTRLLLGVTLLLAVAVGSMALVSGHITTVRFEHYLRAAPPHVDVERWSAPVADHLRRVGSWEGIDAVLARVAAGSRRRAVLIESGGRVHVAPADRNLTVRPLGGDGVEIATRRSSRGGPLAAALVRMRGGARVVGADGATAGQLFLAPLDERVPPPEVAFVGSVRRSLAVVAIATGLAGLLLAFALARRVVGPVEDLTRAARRIEQGDLEARVQPRGRDEVGALGRTFNAMAERLARTERQRRELVADVAHELRTPLTNLRCQIEALEDGLARPDAATLHSLHEETTLLQRLVEDLQDLALADAGRLALHRRDIDLGEEVERSLSIARPRAEAAGVTLAANVESGLPPVHVDPERLAQVLRNLIENALTHTPRGGRVDVRVARAGDGLEIAVEDTGVGIAPEHLANVFERFWRADPSRARATGGAGLGLAIVQQIVSAHGGRVRAESEPGRGSRFSVVLPAAPSGAG